MSRFQKSYSDAEVRRLARSLLSFLGVLNTSKVDVVACLRTSKIWTIRGVKRLIFEICTDSDLGTDDARTAFHGDSVKISVKSSVHAAAAKGERRARFTLAHELGHAVMHDGVMRARITGASGSQVRNWEKPYEAPERLANKFAEAFLVDDAVAASMPSAKEISEHFGISEKAASLVFSRIQEEKDRAESAERVRKKAEAFKARKVADPVLSCKTLADVCPTCGQTQLVQDGPKHTCLSCGRTGDHFQDGDRLSG